MFSRASGAPLREGNRIRLLKNAAENYPAWLDAIHSARRTIHIEMYIIHEDEQGRLFADALISRGFLGLGSKESLRFSEAAGLFTDFAMNERIYRRKGLS